jgi:hypothetical protein
MTQTIKKFLSILILLFLFTACSSSKKGPTKDICEIKKHYKDNVFQILINGRAINDHFYIYQDAVEITGKLADENKCML